MTQRLIYANALEDFIENRYSITWEANTYEGGIKDACTDILEFMNEQPTIDAEPVRHGKWIFVNCATGLRCQCSECLHWVDAGTDRNYCPNCGARMDKDV